MTSSSISDGETVLINSGLIIQFNSSLPDSFFEADTIIKEIEIVVPDTVESNTFPLEIWEIKDSQSFLLNNEPQSFWYDPNNYTCAFIGYTTVADPDGVGEGLNLLDGANQLLVGGIFDITIYGDNGSSNDLEGIKAVPNPYLIDASYNEISRKIRFTRLPNQCTINIYTLTNELIISLSHNDQIDGNYWWDFQNGTIASGIYTFQVITNENTFENGVLIINIE